MENIQTEVLLKKLAKWIVDERNYKYHKGRKYVKAEKKRIEDELTSRGLEKWYIYEEAEKIIEASRHEEPEDDWIMPSKKNLKSRIMYIEYKGGGILGHGRIGRVYFSKSGKSLYYRNQRFASLKGSGFKSNYYDVDTGEEYWISGPRKDQNDKLYGGNKGVEIDDDVREEYYQIINRSK